MSKLEQVAERVNIYDVELLHHQRENTKYLLELDSYRLLIPHKLEAGRYKTHLKASEAYGGWEAPTSQLRGHILGHWLSACARNYAVTGNKVLKAKAEEAVDELEECQKTNGGRWCASIPEKYLTWLAQGREVWVPQYNIHKTFMGLIDMYKYAHYEKALEIAERFAAWFYDWSGSFSEEAFQKILEVETGGMLEIWAELYRITKKAEYKTLLERYYHKSLFDGLLEGKDVLTNMHANTTIPEILGVVAAYDATGEERYLKIAREYWRQAVLERGTYATGGQTCGEVWTPKNDMGQRLDNKNQEHCTVYNMMRLATKLFSYDPDSSYMDYWERNMHNGILAQSYWERFYENVDNGKHPTSAFMTYFLPMRAGSRKGWRGKEEHFFCCHGTVMQANSALVKGIYYQGEKKLYIAQYFDSDCEVNFNDSKLTILQRQDRKNGSQPLSSTAFTGESVTAITSTYPDKPSVFEVDFSIDYEGEEEITIGFRIPAWCKGEYELIVDGESVKTPPEKGFAFVKKLWKKSLVHLTFARKLYTEKLPGRDDLYAFLDGPVVLAGLSKLERTLYGDPAKTETLVALECDREWGTWKSNYRLINQEVGMRILPLKQIGYEKYQVYFPIKAKR